MSASGVRATAIHLDKCVKDIIRVRGSSPGARTHTFCRLHAAAKQIRKCGSRHQFDRTGDAFLSHWAVKLATVTLSLCLFPMSNYRHFPHLKLMISFHLCWYWNVLGLRLRYLRISRTAVASSSQGFPPPKSKAEANRRSRISCADAPMFEQMTRSR